MDQTINVSDKLGLNTYPRRIPVIRWLLLIIEAGLALYITLGASLSFGIAFLAYGIVCLFLIFPLVRCVRCSYYGQRCNFGWGKFWVARFFTKSENGNFGTYYGWSILFWPLRFIPIILGIRLLPIWVTGKFSFLAHGLFLIYLAVLFLHRRFYRARSCPKCHQMAICPVYNGRIASAEIIP
jgi:hypothetical protein